MSFNLSYFYSLSLLTSFTELLKKNASKALEKWPPMMEKLITERDLARENAEYLSTLHEYFIVSN